MVDVAALAAEELCAQRHLARADAEGQRVGVAQTPLPQPRERSCGDVADAKRIGMVIPGLHALDADELGNPRPGADDLLDPLRFGALALALGQPPVHQVRADHHDRRGRGHQKHDGAVEDGRHRDAQDHGDHGRQPRQGRAIGILGPGARQRHHRQGGGRTDAGGPVEPAHALRIGGEVGIGVRLEADPQQRRAELHDVDRCDLCRARMRDWQAIR